MSSLSKLYLDTLREKDCYDSKEVKDTKDKLYKALEDLGIDRKICLKLEELIIDNQVAIEEQGFILGFKTATAIWRECS